MLEGKLNQNNITISPITIAAHELKAPLNLIRQLTLSLDDDNLVESEKKIIVQNIQLVSEKAIRLTTDLTKVSRIETLNFDFEPINPWSLYNEVIFELLPLYSACNRVIKINYKKSTPLVFANRELLHRVIANFADNALQYGQTEYPVKLFCVSKGKSKLRLGVRDYGPSIDKNTWRNIKSKLFNPESIISRPSSSGLGLYISQEFARIMNGNIGITRHYDGASFYVDLPVSRQMNFI